METLILKEVSQGKEMALQLQALLKMQPSSTGENRDYLLHKILHSYDQALFMLRHLNRHGGTHVPPPANTNQQDSRQTSLFSDDSDLEIKDEASRKRKAAATTQTVRIWSETGIEGQNDDGYNWRKCGQKDILGASHPRPYDQGCLATKRAQRSDEDPTMFDIKYTCNPPIALPGPRDKDPNPQQPHFHVQTSLEPENITTTTTIFSNGNNNITNNHYGGFDQNFNSLLELELNPIFASIASILDSPQSPNRFI